MLRSTFRTLAVVDDRGRKPVASDRRGRAIPGRPATVTGTRHTVARRNAPATKERSTVAALEDYRAALKALLGASYSVMAANGAPDGTDPPLEPFLNVLTAVADYNLAAIFTTADDGREGLVYRVQGRPARGKDPARWLQELLERLDVRAGPASALYLPDISAMNGSSGAHGGSAGLSLRTVFALPLTGGRDGQAGTVVIGSNKPHAYRDEQRSLLAAYADQISAVITAGRMRSEVRELAITGERERIAREMHNSVAQSLYSISLYADAARLALTGGNTDSALRHLAAIKGEATSAGGDARRIISGSPEQRVKIDGREERSWPV